MNGDGKSQYTKLARVNDIAENTGVEVRYLGRSVAIWKIKGKLYATDGSCKHLKAPLVKGRIYACEITCKWHHWRYDIPTGKCKTNDWAQLRTFPVKVEGEDVLVDIATLTNAPEEDFLMDGDYGPLESEPESMA